MTEKQFIDACSMSGYCKKTTARKYAKSARKEVYGDNDFIEAYRLENEMGSISNVKGMREIHGTNGKSTCYGHVIGNSSVHQDWV